MTTENSPVQIWQKALTQLQLTMGQTVFNNLLMNKTGVLAAENGHWQIGVVSKSSCEWLVNRHAERITEILNRVAGREITVEFVVKTAEMSFLPWPDEATADDESLPDNEPPPVEPVFEAEPLSPGLQIARHPGSYNAFFGKGGTGFAMISHLTTRFWRPMLGQSAFELWLQLSSLDPRSLKAIEPNFWSPPAKYTFAEMAAWINRKHSRCITGGAIECEHSRHSRLNGQPLQSQNDCCSSSAYALLSSKPHCRRQGLVCEHWQEGALEVLRRSNLAVVELKPGERFPTIQVWRLPCLLTPTQYARLNEHLQLEFDSWLKSYGSLFVEVEENVSKRMTRPELETEIRRVWAGITEPSLIPLMPGYDLAEVNDNFDQREKWQSFLAVSYPNPKLTSSHSHTHEAEDNPV